MKDKRFTNIFAIMVLAIIFTFGMAVSVMADDSEEAPAALAEEATVEVSTPEPAPAVVEEAPAAVEETVAPEDSNDGVVAEETVEEEFFEEFIPEDAEEESGELGDASSYDPETRLTIIQHSDGSVSVEPEEEESVGELGEASSAYYDEAGEWHEVYDPRTGLTTVTFTPFESPQLSETSSTYEAPVYEGTSYRTTSSAYFSDTFVPFVAEEPAKDVIQEVKEASVTPVVAAEETEVLGDYEAAASSKDIPLTAGLAFFTSALIGVGVLWKLGILTF